MVDCLSRFTQMKEVPQLKGYDENLLVRTPICPDLKHAEVVLDCRPVPCAVGALAPANVQ
jgi:hypothetical protein